ncbi:hypothetical protein CH75_16695 [Dyella jiangningensis]|nr:hypothetical protein CH75_16695 [Dyella jiangningensis]
MYRQPGKPVDAFQVAGIEVISSSAQGAEWLVYHQPARQGRRGMSKWILVIGCGLLAACSGGRPSGDNVGAPAPPAPSPTSISGTYVAFGHVTSTDQVFVEALRLTQSAPGQFTGTLESTSITRAGKGNSSSQNVSGFYDGNHVTFAIDEGIGHSNRNATWAPGVITMSWVEKDGQLAHEQFDGKTEEQYASMLQTLGNQRQNLAATDAAVTKAKEADAETAKLAGNLQRFLDKEAAWSLDKAENRRKKTLAYGDAGVAKIKQLLALHQSIADVSANNVEVSMNTTQIQLGLALDSDARVVEEAQQAMAKFDHAIAISPCLAPDGSLVPNPLPACALLPGLVLRYRAVHGAAQSLLAELSSIDGVTRSDYDKRLREAKRLVNAQR